MKLSHAISNEIISFSISLDGNAYAIIGGVNPDQIVGGDSSIKYFPKN